MSIKVKCPVSVNGTRTNIDAIVDNTSLLCALSSKSPQARAKLASDMALWSKSTDALIDATYIDCAIKRLAKIYCQRKRDAEFYVRNRKYFKTLEAIIKIKPE